MWDQFALAVLIGIVFLFLPGSFFLRAFGCSWIKAVAFSPVIGVAGYAVLSIVLGGLSVTCSWWVLFGFVSVISLAACIVAMIYRNGVAKKKSSFKSAITTIVFDYQLALLYVGVAAFAGLAVFVGCFGSADAFAQAYDNIYHLGVVRSFVDSDNWSFLSVSLFMTADFNPPLSGSGFYPAGWHILCAMIVQALSVSVEVAVNAVNFIFSFVVYPLGMYCLMASIFPKSNKIVLLGSFSSLALGSFPWGFLTFGPLYPNLASFALLPLVMAAFIGCIDSRVGHERFFNAVVVVVGIFALAVMQPNTVFSMGVFLAPYCVFRVFRASRQKFSSLKWAIVLSAVFIVFVCVFWWGLYNASFMQATLSQLYPKYYSKPEAAVHLLTFWFRDSAPNVILGAFVIAGVIYSFMHRKYLWLVFSYGIAAVMYLVNASCVDVSFLKSLLTGFWYSDIYRIEAMLGVFAIPLLTLGIVCIVKLLRRGIERFVREPDRRLVGVVSASCITLVFVLAAYCPVSFYGEESQFGKVLQNMKEDYALTSESLLSSEELDFIEDAKAVVGDSLVINLPDDGSAFAYPIADMNAYYRNTRTYGTGGESRESVTIREELSDVAQNTAVQQALSSIDAKYLLLLDQGTTESMPRLFTWDYHGDLWEDMTTITDETPGFEVVLSSGDMRLYKILY